MCLAGTVKLGEVSSSWRVEVERVLVMEKKTLFAKEDSAPYMSIRGIRFLAADTEPCTRVTYIHTYPPMPPRVAPRYPRIPRISAPEGP